MRHILGLTLTLAITAMVAFPAQSREHDQDFPASIMYLLVDSNKRLAPVIKQLEEKTSAIAISAEIEQNDEVDKVEAVLIKDGTLITAEYNLDLGIISITNENDLLDQLMEALNGKGKEVAAANTSLLKALIIAEAHSNGVAYEARARMDDGTLFYDVDVLRTSGPAILTVDANTGAIAQRSNRDDD